MRLILLVLALTTVSSAQSAEDAIRSALDRQVGDWNRGDIRAFMQGYDNSDATLFVGARVVRGYRRVLERYVASYPTKEKMGRLTFSDVEVRPLGPEYALAVGRFHLDRSSDAGGASDGIFTLTFEKETGGWKIIADHTSAIPQPSH